MLELQLMKEKKNCLKNEKSFIYCIQNESPRLGSFHYNLLKKMKFSQKILLACKLITLIKISPKIP